MTQANPLIALTGLPPFDRTEPAQVKPAIESLLADGRVLVERLAAGGIEAAGVLQAAAEAALVELRRHLVVLFVGGAGVLRDWPGLQVGNVRGAIVGDGLVAQTLRQQAADANPDDGVGQEVFLKESIDHGWAEGCGLNAIGGRR